MALTRRIQIQLIVFILVSVTAATIMSLGYIRLPAMMFGVGRYTVTVELPEAGGLYAGGNVTYRGTEVGRVDAVELTDSGVQAVLSLKSGIDIPSDLNAEVHSQSAVGEQYVALLPQSANSAPLKNGDVIPRDRTSVPPDINSLLNATNRGLQAIPHGDLKTVIDESATAVGGLGPEISRLVKGSTQLAIDAGANLESITTLIDEGKPVLDSQANTSDAITAWASHLATVTGELERNNDAVTGIIQNGSSAADSARQLIDRVKPTLPVLLANLVSVGEVAVTYQNGLEQLLVLLPQGTAMMQATTAANRNNNSPFAGSFLDFKLNLNLPPPCMTGFLPPQQQRSAANEDYPARAPGDLYCRIRQDDPMNAVRGARNIPCETVPGKRAPTVKMCESDEQYVPLNDGYNWKGDPNATLSGQAVPQLPPDAIPEQNGPPPPSVTPPPLTVAQYDPATGSYVGPDGRLYTQSDLAASTSEERKWQDMLMPPAG